MARPKPQIVDLPPTATTVLSEELTAQRIDWLIDHVSRTELPWLTRDLLAGAVRACETGDLETLAQLVLDWTATVEESARPARERARIRRQRDEIESGQGLTWAQFADDIY